ncbi:MAG: hypothetical protein M3Q36_03590 [bacterium]|nr:hypothetical protein [bacterium]
MKRLITLSSALLLLFVALPHSVFAARPTKPSGGGTTSLIGYDVSYPQCGRTLPTNHAFAVVGINGGNAASDNDCLASQLAWAKTASGLANQPKVQVYVNTANPGEVINLVSTWPTNNIDNNNTEPLNRYGNTCDGSNSLSCSWLYGWNRAIDAEKYFKLKATEAGLASTATADYTWWLDVETMNTWQSGSESSLRKNVAALEGWADYYKNKEAEVGLYSTAYQWGEITGNYISSSSSLNNLANWRPSGATLKNAQKNCGVAPLTPGGFISLTQYVKNNLDHNHSCV